MTTQEKAMEEQRTADDGGCGNQDMLTIEVPMDGFSEKMLANLDKLIASKADLIREVTGADILLVERTKDRLRFPWFKFTEEGDTVTSYACFIAALCSEAKKVCAICE